MRSAQIDERQPPVQFPADRIGQRQRRHDRARVFGHLDEVGATERGAELVLDAALPPEMNGLDGVRRAGNLRVRAVPSREPIQRTEERHSYRRRGAGRCARRRVRSNRDLDVGIVWRPDFAKRCFDQRVQPPARRVEIRRVPRPAVPDVKDHARFPTARWKGVDAHGDERTDSDVEDLPVTRDPRVGPPTVVANPNGSGRVDDAERPTCHSNASRFTTTLPLLTRRRHGPPSLAERKSYLIFHLTATQYWLY